jgi:hypothetical protein
MQRKLNTHRSNHSCRGKNRNITVAERFFENVTKFVYADFFLLFTLAEFCGSRDSSGHEVALVEQRMFT